MEDALWVNMSKPTRLYKCVGAGEMGMGRGVGWQCGPLAHGGLGTWRVGGRVEGG